MKRILPLLLVLISIPALLSAREVVRLTRYGGQEITGISAAHMFQVELVKTDQTRAVIEIDSDLEQYLRFTLKPDGIVEVDLNIPKGEQRRIERILDWNKRTLKLTVYLPEFRFIKLGDMARLTVNDQFNGDQVEIKAEDMAKITRLDLDAESITVRADDMASLNLTLWCGTLNAKANDMAKVTLRGQAREAYAESNDMANIKAEDFKAEEATLKAADMAKASMYVSRYLYARSSDMAAVSYTGNPPQIDLKTPKRTIYRVNQ